MIQKSNIPINFSQGLDTKTDPFQVSPGKMLSLKNSVFTKGGLLQKRNGFSSITALPDTTYKHLTTLNGNLTAIGPNFSAYSQGSQTWVNKGTLPQLNLSVLPVVRSNLNQIQADSVVSDTNIVCTVYTEDNAGTLSYKYVITDYITGQNIVAPTLIPAHGGTVHGSPRVFILGNHFVIVFTNTISGAEHLQYFAINIINPTIFTGNINITSSYVPSNRMSWDGVVAGSNLYIAYDNIVGGQNIRITYITAALGLPFTTVVFASVGKVTATIMSLAADISTPSAPIIYASYYDSVSQDGYTFSVDKNLNPIINPPVQTINNEDVLNLATAAQDGVLSLFYEINNNYSYDSSIPTHYINTNTVTDVGVVGTKSTLVRSVGLASKAFIINENMYFMAVYFSDFQPTFFLMNSLGKVIAKLAYSNSGGYLSLGIPGVTIRDDVAYINYLIKDLIQSVNKTQGLANAAGIYAQTGINIATFNTNPASLITAEIGNNLNLSGGFLWMYDGSLPVEQNFHVWPDNVELTDSITGGGIATSVNSVAQQYFYQAIYEWTDSKGNIFRSAPSIPVEVDFTGVSPTPITFTSTFSAGATSITVSAVTGLVVGQLITDVTTGANIEAGTRITSINGFVIGLSLPTVNNSGSPDTLQTVDTASITINVPTLRLTYKIASPVKIVIYRWSTAQPIYYQVTSIISPLLNNTAVDSVSFLDTQPDTVIAGNSIIYTTGGVIENIAPPATQIMALYKSRLFLVDSEDGNLLWYSKQVIEGTPVEMSDLFTIFVAPTTSAQGSTGPVTALSALDDKLIIFKEDAIYYMTGNGPDNTGSNNDFSDPTFISSTIGCTNQNSIVFMPNGLMFQSDKGIWLLGRDLSTSYIGAPVEDFNSAIVLSALTIPGTNQVRFTLDSGITLMYDYYYNQWGTFTNIPALSSTLYQGFHTFINIYGEVRQESPGVYLDGSIPVLMSFTTSWLNLSGLQGFERAYEFYLLGTYITPHKLQCQIAYDYNSSPTQSTMVYPDNYSPPWGAEQLWGDGPFWGGVSTLEQWRVFFQQQKCQAFQITINEVFDHTFGVPAGAGFTLSGLNLTVGGKAQRPKLSAARQVG